VAEGLGFLGFTEVCLRALRFLLILLTSSDCLSVVNRYVLRTLRRGARSVARRTFRGGQRAGRAVALRSQGPRRRKEG
jgi:hypothetical protein